MNIGDGGTVSRESGAQTRASGTMVGNPPQTLPPELRGDVPHSQQGKLRTAPDCKTPDACSEATHSNHCSDALPPSQKGHNTPLLGPPAMNSTLHERAECHKAKADGTAGGVYPAHPWTGGKKAAVESPVNASHGGIGLNKKNNTPAPSVISLAPAFQCSTLLFSSNLTSPLCKITLPPGTGQIAALRKATASQFQKVPVPEAAQQNPQNPGVAPILHTYPYHFPAGRGPTSEKRPPSTKLRCDVSSSKNSKLGVEQKTCASSGISPSITVPILPQPPASAPPTHFTISPSAAICCSPTLASVTTQSKLLNLMDKGPAYRSVDKTSLAYLRLKSPSTTEEHTVGCSVEEREMPLDLSSKSKRQKSNASELQNNAAPASEHRPVEGNQKSAPNALKRTQASGFGSASYSILPDTQRNGSNPKLPSSKLFNHQTLEPATSWTKHPPPGGINAIPGTYVGVASPILASTLRSKDGKGAAFVEDLQSFAKQETISIVDQGEQLSSLGKESPFAAKSAQHCKSIKHANSTGSVGAQAFPSKDALPSVLSPPANSHLHRKCASSKGPNSYPPVGIKPLWEKPAVLPQGTSSQRKAIQGSPKTKTTTASCEATVFHSPPPKLEDEKWGKNNKSPLSNLECIVKQKALETTALTGEAYCGLSSVGARRTEMTSPLAGCQNSQMQPPATAAIPTFRPAERRDSKPERTSFPGEPVHTSKRPEGQRDTSGEKRGKTEESKAKKEGEAPSKNSWSNQLSNSDSQGNREEMEKVVTEKRAGENEKDEKSSTQKDPSSQIKVESIALSVLQGQSGTESKVERRTNGAKEASPLSERGTVAKQKKTSPKKTGKEKGTPVRPKKTPAKRPLNKDSPNGKQGSLLKKVSSAYVISLQGFVDVDGFYISIQKHSLSAIKLHFIILLFFSNNK